MRAAVFLFAALLVPQAPPQTGTIRVTVQDARTGKPLAGASVSLSDAAAGDAASGPRLTIVYSADPSPAALAGLPARDQIAEIRITSNSTIIRTIDGQTVSTPLTNAWATTDPAGIAVFTNIPPGNYVVRAANAGMPVAAGVTLASATADVLLSVPPGAKISGRILDAAGRPLAGAYVWAGSPSLGGDRLMLSPSITAQSDLNGNYSLALNREGTFYIRAEPSRTSRGIDTVGAYYPGVAEIEKASAIPIRAGDTLVGIDLVIPEQRLFSISGRVSNATRVASFVISPGSTEAPALRFDVANERISENGEFLLTRIPAGSWDVFPVIAVGSGSQAYARARVDVRDQDITNLDIATHTSRASVRFVVSGLPNEETVRLGAGRWRPVNSPLLGPTAASIPLTDVREHTLEAVAPGRYRLQLAAPRGYYIADLRIGNTSVIDTDAILEVTEAMDNPVEIVMRAGGGMISGTITGPAEVKVASRVVLVPAGTRRENLMLYKTNTIAAASGTFSFENVPPGEYKVFAWQTFPEWADQSAAVAAQYDEQGVPVRVVDGITTSVQAPLIPE